MTRKYHVWINTDEHVTLIQCVENIEEIKLDLSIFRKGMLTITYEEEL